MWYDKSVLCTGRIVILWSCVIGLSSMNVYVWNVCTGSYVRWDNMRHKRGDVYCLHIPFQVRWVIWKGCDMSSMNTMTNVSKKSLNTRFIRSMNAAGAFVRPNDMTINSWCPYLEQKAVFEISLSLILNWWYPEQRSIFEKTVALYNWLNKSSILGKGSLFLMVTLFNSL